MTKEFEPYYYVLPDRKALWTPKIYEHEKSHINHAITDVSNYALTTDIWSSCHVWVSPYISLMLTLFFVVACLMFRNYLITTLGITLQITYLKL